MALDTQDEQMGMVMILAKRIAQIQPLNDTELAIQAQLVDIAYSLRKAVMVNPGGYSDEDAHRNYGDRVLSAAKAMESPVPVFDSVWEAGYYFNSALTRIASVNEMMREFAGEQPNLGPEDSRNMSRIRPEIGEILAGPHVTFDNAAKSAWKLASAFLHVLKDAAA